MSTSLQEKLQGRSWELQSLYQVYLYGPCLWLPSKFAEGILTLASGEAISKADFYRCLWDLDRQWYIGRTSVPQGFDTSGLPKRYAFYRISHEGMAELKRQGLIKDSELKGASPSFEFDDGIPF